MSVPQAMLRFVELTLAESPAARTIFVNPARIVTIRRIAESAPTRYSPALPERTQIYFGRYGDQFDALDTLDVVETPAEIFRRILLAGPEGVR